QSHMAWSRDLPPCIEAQDTESPVAGQMCYSPPSTLSGGSNLYTYLRMELVKHTWKRWKHPTMSRCLEAHSGPPSKAMARRSSSAMGDQGCGITWHRSPG